ncbi:MAG TPA: T9SS type A sorting domain-containing protein, partial [Longimicrobiales bacterium]|nr:T9SS type A sorting domain-containing protein [Longimicrobiales bacterium]
FPVQGRGFGMYINGERYIFAVNGGNLPASGQTWTLRTYTGILRASSTATGTSNDPSGYSWRGDLEPRQPMVTGITFNASSTSASGPQGEADITQVHTVPDPYYVRSAFELGPSNKVLRFVNLPPQAIIRIYTLNGTLVRVIEQNDALGGAETSWDLRNRNNQFVASGVYFYVVEAANGKRHTGKFTIVQFAR